MTVANYNCAINLVYMPKKEHRVQWGSLGLASTQKHHRSPQGTISTDPDRSTRRGGNPNWDLSRSNTLSRPFPGLLEDSCSLIVQTRNLITIGKHQSNFWTEGVLPRGMGHVMWYRGRTLGDCTWFNMESLRVELKVGKERNQGGLRSKNSGKIKREVGVAACKYFADW